MTVERIMSKDPLYVKDSDLITHARQVMRDHFLRGVPVVNDHMKVGGILTDGDILKVKSTKSNVTVKGYVKEVPMITPEMEILKAARLMLDANQHRVPVVSGVDRQLMGIISDADILAAVRPTKKSPPYIEEIMVTDVISCYPDDSVTKVWHQMLEHDYTGIPVVSHTNETVGMVTRRDIIKAGYARVGEVDGRGAKAGDAPKVERVMSTPMYTLPPEASVKEAIDKILQYDIGRIAVASNKKLLGVVSRSALLSACLVGTGF
ncbi:MAG: CBS domain-containing protein [Methanomethylovorans sp.]|uniref:CBS domain-containing protein n=1 Tax=Methanomethylovorans sp. TaxID=2758717 RepID=UPI00345ECE70